MEMDYNYHTHTYRCNHAYGTPEEYVINAIDMGIKYMGFSEHFPYKFLDYPQSSYRLAVEETEDYISDIKALRSKYKEHIDIKIGFEMEYYRDWFDKMLLSIAPYDVDYIILGEHFNTPEVLKNSRYNMAESTDVCQLSEYVDLVIEAIKKEVFTYVAHPDVINFNGDMEFYKKEMRRICIAAREYNTPLEINLLGIMKKREYPKEDFWRLVGEEKASVTIGIDAHDATAMLDKDGMVVAKEIIERNGLNYIGRPELKAIK